MHPSREITDYIKAHRYGARYVEAGGMWLFVATNNRKPVRAWNAEAGFVEVSLTPSLMSEAWAEVEYSNRRDMDASL